MKKNIILIFILITCVSLWAQTSNVDESSYYKVYSDISLNHARETAQKLDAYFDFYSSYFHFNPTNLEGKLTLRLFDNKEDFDAYLMGIISETRDSFVFLQYSNPEKNELVGFMDTEKEKFNTYLAHYSLIQYLKSFVKNPPLWLQMGFAVYFEKSYYDPYEDQIVYVENLDWLNTLKSLIVQVDPQDLSGQVYIMTNLLTMNPETFNRSMEEAYAQSWGLVYFLMNTSKIEYSRILWDSISLLAYEASRKENELQIINGAFGWVTKNRLINSFSDYVMETKTFPVLVQEGMSLYNMQDYDASEASFLKAVSLRDDHPLPFYYLGLINYSEANYSEAQSYYDTSLAFGGEESFTYYAMGVNAYAAGQFNDAKIYLQYSFQSDPSGYGEKAFELLTKIEEN